MEYKVDIISKNQVFNKAIFKIDEVHLRHSLYNGQMSQELTRLSLERGDSVAALIYDSDHDKLLLVEQFRYPTYGKGPGWIMELPAGMVDANESPEAAMIRELKEECGHAITIRDLHFICQFYVSPGGTSERIFLYYATVSGQTQFSAADEEIQEGEDIRKILVPVDEVMKQLDDGQIIDAKTIIALQWYHYRDNK